MTNREIEAGVLDAIAQMPIVDAHEHLPPEAQRVSAHVDFATLFSHYTQTDLKAAGMTPEDYESLQAADTDLDEKWALFAPHWERIRFTGYARPALLAAQRFYGIEDITEDSYRLLSERMQETNKPGLYKTVLRDACNIQACLTQIGSVPDEDRDLLRPLLPMGHWTQVPSLDEVERRGEQYNTNIQSLADYLQVMRAGLEDWKSQGVVGIKMVSTHLGDPGEVDAVSAFNALLAGKRDELFVLTWYLHQQMLQIAAELDLIVAVHCGIIWDNWNNFYANDPRNLVPLLMKHRNAKFDLYHAAIPWPREMAVIGKDFPNAYLNLCWCHIISPRMTVSFLDEWIDMVPIHKISGFGGDYNRPVEKVYGHLLMAKENIARVLAGRIADGTMTESQAIGIAQRLLYDNPKELYELDI